MTARTRNSSLVGSRGCKLQQFGERCGPSPMHRRAHSHFDRFQIQTLALAAIVKDGTEQLVYFARDFLLNRFRRFFSCSLDGCSSTGRSQQIFSLISTNVRLSC